MAVTRNLTPADLLEEDYPIAASPTLGGECEVFMATKAARVLGVYTYYDDVDANAQWEPVVLPTRPDAPSGTPDADPPKGPIIAVVQGELRTDGTAATITYAGLTATFEVPAWARNTGTDFPVGRAVELLGTYNHPTSLSHADNRPVMTNALRGTRIALIEMPALSDFSSIGVTTGQRIKLPTNTTKFIRKHLESANWTTKGNTEIGSLDFTTLDLGYDDGLSRFAGLKCQVLIKVIREGRVIPRHEFYLDYVPAVERENPEGDGESKISATGMYSRAAMLIAE